MTYQQSGINRQRRNQKKEKEMAAEISRNGVMAW